MIEKPVPTPRPFLTKEDLDLLKSVVMNAWMRGEEQGIQRRDLRLLEEKLQKMTGD